MSQDDGRDSPGLRGRSPCAEARVPRGSVGRVRSRPGPVVLSGQRAETWLGRPFKMGNNGLFSCCFTQSQFWVVKIDVSLNTVCPPGMI